VLCAVTHGKGCFAVLPVMPHGKVRVTAAHSFLFRASHLCRAPRYIVAVLCDFAVRFSQSLPCAFLSLCRACMYAVRCRSHTRQRIHCRAAAHGTVGMHGTPYFSGSVFLLLFEYVLVFLASSTTGFDRLHSGSDR
jgi:hypothetical protein